MKIQLTLLATLLSMIIKAISLKRFPRNAQKFAVESDVKRFINKSICSIFTLMIIPNLVIASESSEPKLEFFKKQDSISVGSVIFDETDKLFIEQKLQRVQLDWNKMKNNVEKALLTSNKQEAKATVTNALFSLKSDMRLLAKSACQGDIFVRKTQSSEANFDYNSGQFEVIFIYIDLIFLTIYIMHTTCYKF